MASLGLTPASSPSPAPGLQPAQRALLVLALLWPSGLTWLYFIALDGAAAPWPQAAYSVGKLLQFSLPLVGLGLSRRFPFPFSRPSWQDFGLGLAGGLVVAVGIAGLYGLWLRPAGFLAVAGGVIARKAGNLGLTTPATFAAAGLFYSIVHSWLEEYYWRWFVFGQLRRAWSLAGAVGLSSVAFGAHHVLLLGSFFGPASAGTWLLAAAVVAGGAVWAVVYDMRGNLYACWLSHALIDAALFAVGYDLVRPALAG